jgi:diguanylate cyclase (GGDEF)-like protein
MQITIKDIIKQTFINLDQANTLPTPNEYAKEFYSIASNANFPLRDFDKLSSITKILQQSMEPTLSKNDSDGLINLILDLNNNPEKIFDENTQKKIKNFLETKTKVDSHEIELKTQKISTLVKYLNTFLSSSVIIGNKGCEELGEFIEILENFEDTDSELQVLSKKILDVTKNIHTSVNETREKFQKGQENIQQLQAEIEKLKEELDEAKRIGELDHLTGIHTKKSFDKKSKLYELNFIQHHVKYAVVFYDIDFFKNVNATYGRDTGDFIINAFAKVLNSSTRKNDIVARYSDEKFIAIVLYQDENELVKYTARIKNIIKNYTFKYNDNKIDITFSSGVAYRNKVIDLEACIKKAEELLYEAKNTGRDRTIFGNNQIL